MYSTARPWNTRGHFLGAFPRPVRDEDALGAGAVQVLRRQLAHLARADDHHRMALQRAENLARQFHRRVADRDRHLPDAGLRAHSLGDAESARENLFEQPADRAFGLGDRVGALELAQNLRLADHHRIEAGRHAEKMLNRLARFQPVKMAFECVRRALPAFQKTLHDERRALRRPAP